MQSAPTDPVVTDRLVAAGPPLLAPLAAGPRAPSAPLASPVAVALVAAVRPAGGALADGRAAELLDRLSRLARTPGAGVTLLDRDDAAGELILAVRARPRESGTALLRRAHQLATQLGAGAPDGLRLAIGGAADVEGIAESVGQARLALDVAGRLGGMTSPLRYDDLGLYAFLHRALAACPEDGRAFVAQVLGPLRAYDAATGSELLRTLRAYFANDGSIERTATELALHRHTVRYRLGRIADLTRRDPSTTRGREELNLALIIDRMLPE